MEFEEIIRKRTSVRKFSNKKIEKEKLRLPYESFAQYKKTNRRFSRI